MAESQVQPLKVPEEKQNERHTNLILIPEEHKTKSQDQKQDNQLRVVKNKPELDFKKKNNYYQEELDIKSKNLDESMIILDPLEMQQQQQAEKCALVCRLISLVRHQRALYDSHHLRFQDDVHKEQLWQSIANRLAQDVNKCLSLWAQLRHHYQGHVRRLQNFFCQLGRPLHQRPVMLYEEELLFLYAHVAKYPLQKPTSEDVVVCVSVEASDIIDVDLLDKQTGGFRCTREYRRLIEAVRNYPQLYDTHHSNYWNYRHRGLIWGSISNELRVKATKLMKLWMQLQTRFEWEMISQSSPAATSEFQQLLSFLSPHLPQMWQSVCKCSLYLKDGWYDPIEEFPIVIELINALKSLPELCHITSKDQPARYHELWLKVGNQLKLSHQRCEITWLVLRALYQELSHMREVGYLLQDKWYFEDVIASLYKQMGQMNSRRRKQTAKKFKAKGLAKSTSVSSSYSSVTLPAPPPPLPLAIVYPPFTNTTSTRAKPMTLSSLKCSLPLPIPTPASTGASASALLRSGLQVTIRPKFNLSNTSIITRPLTPLTSTGVNNVAPLLGSPTPKLVPVNENVTIMAPPKANSSNNSTASSVTVPQSNLNCDWNTIITPAAATTSSFPTPHSLPTVDPRLRDITVELVENTLHIRGTPLTYKYQMNMSRTANFIREILFVPQMYNKNLQGQPKYRQLWLQVSRKFGMPELVCRACWNFLQDNISLFPRIAPMSELMRPFENSLKFWEKSDRLFSKFDEIAIQYQWMEIKDKLPELMKHFSQYEHLYWDLRKPRPGETLKNLQPSFESDRQEVWRLASERFPNMNHRDIWSMFKIAFCSYMDDLERGIENPWPQNWWQALEQLRFLVDVRYHPLEPYYYIVHHKFQEEVKRCCMYENQMTSGSTDQSRLNNIIELPWETEEAKRLPTGEVSRLATPASATSIAAEDLVRHMEHNLQTLPTVNAYELTRILRRYPHTFEKATTLEKRTAWKRVAQELNTTVTECRRSLQHALRELRILKIRDPTACQLPLTQKYYRHMDEIYKQVKLQGGPPMARTPRELNQSLAEPMEVVHRERYIPEINLVSCKPSLVLQNWSRALDNFCESGVEELIEKITHKFAKYAQEANDPRPKSVIHKRSNANIIQKSAKRVKLNDDNNI